MYLIKMKMKNELSFLWIFMGIKALTCDAKLEEKQNIVFKFMKWIMIIIYQMVFFSLFKNVSWW